MGEIEKKRKGRANSRLSFGRREVVRGRRERKKRKKGTGFCLVPCLKRRKDRKSQKGEEEKRDRNGGRREEKKDKIHERSVFFREKKGGGREKGRHPLYDLGVGRRSRIKMVIPRYR